MPSHHKEPFLKISQIVSMLQVELNAQGYANPPLKVDGIAGPKTIAALHESLFPKADLPAPSPVQTGSTFTRKNLAVFAENLCKQNIREGSKEHAIIIADYVKMFGHGNWAWCGATVRYECLKAGLNIPLLCPSKFGYSFAFVEAWQQWAIEKGFYHDNDGKFDAQGGDIVIFDWTQKSIDLPDNDRDNHIGVLTRKEGDTYIVAEGNTSNMTAMKKRTSIQIQGFIRIPDGYKF
jgi:hypothetical protein